MRNLLDGHHNTKNKYAWIKSLSLSKKYGVGLTIYH